MTGSPMLPRRPSRAPMSRCRSIWSAAIFVNQSSAFSDYHVTGGNPAGNACLTDAAFVANRFRVAPVRRMNA